MNPVSNCLVVSAIISFVLLCVISLSIFTALPNQEKQQANRQQQQQNEQKNEQWRKWTEDELHVILL
jgi:heme exporter protein D